jgi:hypothetical protein
MTGQTPSVLRIVIEDYLFMHFNELTPPGNRFDFRMTVITGKIIRRKGFNRD